MSATPARPGPGPRWPEGPVPGRAAARLTATAEPQLRGPEFRLAVREIFRAFTSQLPTDISRDQAHILADQEVQDWAGRRLRDGRPVITPADQDRLTRAVLDEQYGLGPLQPYVDHPDVENVNINGPDQVWVRLSGGRKVRRAPIAADNDDLLDLVRAWVSRGAQTSREFSTTAPMLNVSLGGRVRLSAVMSVTQNVHVSVRCHRIADIDLDQLTCPPYLTLSPALAHFLAAAVRAHINILVTGGVDAGKTTLLRALCSAIDPDERIATLESERELFLHLLPRHSDVIAFEARAANSEGAGEIGLTAMIPQALRMNPRRIIVGEVRDQEIRPMLEAMNSGQQGSLATIHANSATEIFSRIVMLAQRGASAMSTEAIHLAIGLCRPFVVHIRQDGPVRHVSEVLEVLPPGDGYQPSRNTIFAPGPDGRAVPAHSLSPEALAALQAAGLDPGVLTREM